jgi:hypothetical protein
MNYKGEVPEKRVLRNFDFEVAETLTSRGAIATCLLLVQACKLIIVVSRT